MSYTKSLIDFGRTQVYGDLVCNIYKNMNKFVGILCFNLVLLFFAVDVHAENKEKFLKTAKFLTERSLLVFTAEIVREESLGYRRADGPLPVSENELNGVLTSDEALYYAEVKIITLKVRNSLKGDDLSGLSLSFVYRTTPLILQEKFDLPVMGEQFYQLRLGEDAGRNELRGFAIFELISIDSSGLYRGGGGIIMMDVDLLEQIEFD